MRFLVTTFLALLPTVSHAVCGDVTGDRAITATDALAVLSAAVGNSVDLVCEGTTTTTLSSSRTLIVDVVGDGVVTSDPEGVACGNDCDAVYEDGTSVELSASQTGGAVFSGWGGNVPARCQGSVDPCRMTMSRDRRVTATFENVNSGLRGLFGQWRFEFTIISTFEDHYRLGPDFTDDGLLIGEDLTSGGIVLVRSGEEAGYEFALLDPGLLLCDLYLFDKVGSDQVAGVQISLLTDDQGLCTSDGFSPNSMSGVRVSALSAVSSFGVPGPLPALLDQIVGDLDRIRMPSTAEPARF